MMEPPAARKAVLLSNSFDKTGLFRRWAEHGLGFGTSTGFRGSDGRGHFCFDLAACRLPAWATASGLATGSIGGPPPVVPGVLRERRRLRLAGAGLPLWRGGAGCRSGRRRGCAAGTFFASAASAPPWQQTAAPDLPGSGSSVPPVSAVPQHSAQGLPDVRWRP
jgi:hypothetical protein